MSFCIKPTVAEKKAVNAPINVINVKIVGAYSNIGEHLINRKTPAVTIVAACINADTGVGPSIASGNHVCKPICADFPIAPINNNKQIIFKIPNLYPTNITALLIKKGTKPKIAANSTVLKVLYNAIIPIVNAKSLILFTISALIADWFACIRVYQKLINK
jgi:hypothetical protein